MLHLWYITGSFTNCDSAACNDKKLITNEQRVINDITFMLMLKLWYKCEFIYYCPCTVTFLSASIAKASQIHKNQIIFGTTVDFVSWRRHGRACSCLDSACCSGFFRQTSKYYSVFGFIKKCEYPNAIGTRYFTIRDYARNKKAQTFTICDGLGFVRLYYCFIPSQQVNEN